MQSGLRKKMLFGMVISSVFILSASGLAQEHTPELPIVFHYEAEFNIVDIDWNFDSTLLAIAEGGDSISVVNIEMSEVDLRLERDEHEIYIVQTIAWSPIENYLLIANNLTKIWDYSDGEWLRSFEFPSAIEFEEYTITGNVNWHPDGDHFATIFRECNEGTSYRLGARVEIWDMASSSSYQIAECVWRGFAIVEWNPQGTQLAINGFSVFDDDGFVDFEEIEIWDVDTAERILTITDLQDPWGLAWSPRGDMIAFTTRIQLNRYMQVWDVTNDELVWQVEANLGVYAPLDWHPSENLIVTGGQDGSVRLWNALSGTELIELPVHDDTVTDVSWSPDGSMLASVGRDGRLFIWDVSELQQSAD